MFQGLVKAALPMVAAAAFMALTATSSPAFTLSAPSLDKPTAASNIEQVNRVRHRGGGTWHRPSVYGDGWHRPGLPWYGAVGALYLTARRSEASRAHLIPSP